MAAMLLEGPGVFVDPPQQVRYTNDFGDPEFRVEERLPMSRAFGEVWETPNSIVE